MCYEDYAPQARATCASAMAKTGDADEWQKLARSATVECNQPADGRFVTPLRRSGCCKAVGQDLSSGRSFSPTPGFDFGAPDLGGP
jgi:hypothetical protein